MAQNINLFISGKKIEKVIFAARIMFACLVGVISVISLGTWYLVLSSDRETEDLSVAFANTKISIDGMTSTLNEIQRSKSPEGNKDSLKISYSKSAILDGAKRKLEALEKDTLKPGMGVSDKLEIVSKTIPPSVWLTEIKSDDSRFEVAGKSVDTSSLNGWISALSSSTALHGMVLHAVQIDAIEESTLPVLSPSPAVYPVPLPMASALPLPSSPLPLPIAAIPKSLSKKITVQQPVWSFRLIGSPPQSSSIPSSKMVSK